MNAPAKPVSTLPNPIRPAFDTSSVEGSVIVNIGPSHPATHGTIQIVAELSGERVIRTDVHCGYLHRGFEKECESHTWHNLIPYVDRLNYCSALINNFAYCEAVEKLMDVEITPRCKYLRTLLSEYSRIADHLTCVAAALMELGAMTAFLYLVTIRDYVYEHLAALTGARVTYTYGRIGGLSHDLPDGWLTRLGEILDEMDTFVNRVHGLVDRNRIFIDRMRDVGVLKTRRSDQLGLHRPDPALDRRASRPAQGHALPRLCRTRIRSARRHQGRQLRPVLRAHARARRVAPHDPPADGDARARPDLRRRPALHAASEAPRLHRDRIADQPLQADHGRPAGAGRARSYAAHEGANGELGFYLVSVGGGVPWKVHCRSPSFVHMGGVHRMLDGYQLADIVPTFGSVNMIGGECDR